MPRSRFYAVLNGRLGTDVYTDWDQCNAMVNKYPGAKFKSFDSSETAWMWLTNESGVRDTVPPSQDHAPITYDRTTPEPGVPRQELIELSDEQEHVVRQCEAGHSIFFTGSAGTGKSVTLKEVIRRLRRMYSSGSVFVTASTGIAAINVGGTTLHSYAGIGLGKEPAEVLIKNIRKGTKAKGRWWATRVLVIDEISMVDGNLFDKLEQISRAIRGNNEPFGGIQLVICGDFFQLPPVSKAPSAGQRDTTKFAFEAESWSRCVKQMITLRTVFRQRDNELIEMLDMMRMGQVDAIGLWYFRKLDREVEYDDGIEPTELFPLRAQVEGANNARLNALPGEELRFIAMDYAFHDMYGKSIKPEAASKLLDDTLAPRVLTLRVGAQVMLIKNIPETKLVNGSIGTIVSFETTEGAYYHGISAAGDDNSTRREASQLDDANTDDSGGDLERNPSSYTLPRWPMVKFITGEVRIMPPMPFEVVNAHGNSEAMRQQVPLILAWALSIHKSQGQTLERVKVDLNGIFEKGQAYVAVSRATSFAGLQVKNFSQDKVMAHPRVVAWAQSIEKKPQPVAEDEMEMTSDEEGYWNEARD